MGKRAAMALSLAAMLAACAPVAPPPAPAPAPAQPPPDPHIAETIALAAAQIRPCYRSPARMSHAARRIVTVLGVRFAADGSLIGLPEVRVQRGVAPDNAPYASAMAEAAGLAVLRCAPLRLPAEYYQGGWDEFELTFSFSAVA